MHGFDNAQGVYEFRRSRILRRLPGGATPPREKRLPSWRRSRCRGRGRGGDAGSHGDGMRAMTFRSLERRVGRSALSRSKWLLPNQKSVT